MEIDEDILREYAERALTRPDNFGTANEAMYVTHGATFTWADRGNDLRAESNYHVALNLITEAAADEDHVIDAFCGHWAHGSQREIFVQVYEGGCPPDCEGPEEFTHEEFCDHDSDEDYCRRFCKHECTSDCTGEPRRFTAAWKEAVSLAEALHGYPVLDDSDLSERESERFEENLAEALRNAKGDYWEDTDAQSEEITSRAIDDLHELHGYEPDGGVDWDDVIRIYGKHRDDYFLEHAQEIADELSRLGLLVQDLRHCPGEG